ncbi:MAG: hypothetical protein R8M45_10635 [Ghiorsea sp.]
MSKVVLRNLPVSEFFAICDGERNYKKIAKLLGVSKNTIRGYTKSKNISDQFGNNSMSFSTSAEFLELIGDSVMSIEIQEKTGLSKRAVNRVIAKLGLSDIVIVNPKNMTSEQKVIWEARKKQRCFEKYGVESISQLQSTMDKKKATNLERYGSESYFKTQDFKDKGKATNLDRYGVEFAMQSQELLQKRKETNLEKYGVESVFQSSDIKDKIKADNLAKYGVENFSQTQEFKDKSKATCLDRYGVEYPIQLTEVKDKRKVTCLEKYGVQNYYQSHEFKEKTKATCLEKYGVEYTSQVQEYKEKSKATNLDRYGVESYTQTKEHKDKKKAVCLEKYGVEHYSQTTESKEKAKATVIETANADDRAWYWDEEQFLEKYCKYVSVYDMAIGEGVQNSTIYSLIQRLGLTEELGIGKSGRSSGEINVYDYICTLSDNVEHSNRKLISPKEIDIYLPDHNLAIEFNGLYWHSEFAGGKDKNYHKNKMEACSRQGINLVMIPDYQWDNDITRGVWKSRLAYLVGKAKSTIYARKCDIIDVGSKQKTKFMVSNHLQGGGQSTIRYGLEYKGELVACMTFSHKGDVYTLERFACSKYTSVVGGFSKLLKHFIKNNEYSSIISFADYGYSDGGVYESNGFVKDRLNPPNYAYTKDYSCILNKQSFRKEKLAIMEGFDYDSTKTERVNMLANGYDIVWGCGIVRYILTNGEYGI